MKRTQPLKVMIDASFPMGKAVIHPNDGFDLGLMNTSHPVKVFLNLSLDDFRESKGDLIQGQIMLENTCRKGCAEISKKCWEKMQCPDNILIVYDSNKLLLLSVMNKTH